MLTEVPLGAKLNSTVIRSHDKKGWDLGRINCSPWKPPATYLTPEGLVSTGIAFSTSQTRVGLTTAAVHTGASRVWVLLFHVGLQRLLVLVMPVAFGTLECLA